MAPAKWHEGILVAFDTETTGISVFDDRIITAAVVYAQPGQRPRTFQWILNPGVDIPDGAAAVHGWTTEALNARVPAGHAISIWTDAQGRVHEKQVWLSEALFEMDTKLWFAMGQGYAVVGANLSYDLSLLEAENIRHGVETLASRPAGVTGIVDVQVIEKQFDPYRKVNYADGAGCRKGRVECGGCGATDKTLTGLCAHYGVRHMGAHDASGDALACIRLVPRLVAVWPEIGRWKLETLHSKQIEWRRDQMLSLRKYFDREGIEHDGCCPEWPVHDRCAVKAVA